MAAASAGGSPGSSDRDAASPSSTSRPSTPPGPPGTTGPPGPPSWQPPAWCAPPAPGVARWRLRLSRAEDGAWRYVDFAWKGCFMLGREEDSGVDATLDAASLMVSRRHAAVLQNKEGSVFVLDLGSSHGTFIGDRKLEAYVVHPWHEGESVGFGAPAGSGKAGRAEASLVPKRSSGTEVFTQPRKFIEAFFGANTQTSPSGDKVAMTAADLDASAYGAAFCGRSKTSPNGDRVATTAVDLGAPLSVSRRSKSSPLGDKVMTAAEDFTAPRTAYAAFFGRKAKTSPARGKIATVAADSGAPRNASEVFAGRKTKISPTSEKVAATAAESSGQGNASEFCVGHKTKSSSNANKVATTVADVPTLDRWGRPPTPATARSGPAAWSGPAVKSPAEAKQVELSFAPSLAATGPRSSASSLGAAEEFPEPAKLADLPVPEESAQPAVAAPALASVGQLSGASSATSPDLARCTVSIESGYVLVLPASKKRTQRQSERSSSSPPGQPGKRRRILGKVTVDCGGNATSSSVAGGDALAAQAPQPAQPAQPAPQPAAHAAQPVAQPVAAVGGPSGGKGRAKAKAKAKAAVHMEVVCTTKQAVVGVEGKCDKCDGPHTTAACPHFKKPREEHKDAWLCYGKTLVALGTPGRKFVLKGARVVRQPGDGSCLFHSLSFGLEGRSDKGKDGRNAKVSALALRRDLARFVKDSPHVKIAGDTLEEWVRWDNRTGCTAYARKMANGAWGGGIEMAACARLKRVNVHVYERGDLPAGNFRRISCFNYPKAKRTIHVLYQGRMHYDALLNES